MQLHTGEWIVLIMILGMLVYSVWDADKNKQVIKAGYKTRLSMYKETLIFLWVPTSVLGVLVLFNIVPAMSLGLVWQGSWQNWSGALLVLLAISFASLNIYRLNPSSAEFKALFDAMQTHSWLMPTTKQELRYHWFAPRSHLRIYRVFMGGNCFACSNGHLWWNTRLSG